MEIRYSGDTLPCSQRRLTEIEPFATQTLIVPEKVVFHMEWYMEHGEFMGPLLLEVGGPRCKRKNLEAYLIDGNHRFHAAKALDLDTVEVEVLNLGKC